MLFKQSERQVSSRNGVYLNSLLMYACYCWYRMSQVLFGLLYFKANATWVGISVLASGINFDCNSSHFSLASLIL